MEWNGTGRKKYSRHFHLCDAVCVALVADNANVRPCHLIVSIVPGLFSSADSANWK